jgi:hypothetical protein
MTDRFWWLVHDGEVCPLEWEDGERLIALSVGVRDGTDESQEFTFRPRGADSDVTVMVCADQPLELLTDSTSGEAAPR